MGDADLIFGSGSGCRGRMHVLILPDRAPYAGLSDALLAADAQHAPLELALCLDGAGVGRGQAWFGTSSEISIGAHLDCAAEVRAAPPGVQHFEHAGEKGRVARFRIGTVPRLLIVGAGPEAPALLHLACVLGWRTRLVDHRPWSIEALAHLADEVLVTNASEGGSRYTDTPVDACVIMTHTATHDLAALKAIHNQAVPYVGVLGPPSRRDELVHLLNDRERTALAGRLRAPVGLNLGGQGPEALALSIVAELQQHFSGRL
jgi:xanthine dehydrogenase accessory factor